MWKGSTSRVMVAGRPKVSVRPDGSTSPRNYVASCHYSNSTLAKQIHVLDFSIELCVTFVG
jgi:hypothetical protein